MPLKDWVALEEQALKLKIRAFITDKFSASLVDIYYLPIFEKEEMRFLACFKSSNNLIFK